MGMLWKSLYGLLAFSLAAFIPRATIRGVAKEGPKGGARLKFEHFMRITTRAKGKTLNLSIS